MSNRLFKNISGIFGCPQEIKDILNKMDEAKGGRDVERDPSKKAKITNKPRVWLDADKKIHINEDITVATTNGLLGEKKYVEIGSDEGQEVATTISEAVSQAKAAGYSAEAVKAVKNALTKKMPKLVTKVPDPEPQPGDSEYIEKEAPDEKPAPKEKTEEEKVRDRLRGFARTIPSFLMAYGSDDTKLENFGDNIPDDIFEEISSITKEEFVKLRDGMDYQTKDEDGNVKTAHFDGLFDEAAFNSSIRLFNEKRRKLGCYYQTSSNEDIFECIPPQTTNQIFTPKRVVKMMVDILEEENPEIFNSTTNTFIDLYMKSGMFITEIARRIFENTREQYDNDTKCIKHILENQLYGFAPTSILDAITKNYIFGFDPEKVIGESHFVQYDATEAVKNGIIQQEVNRLFGHGGDVKFDVVVGNPPYQGDNHQQIYPDFYLGARKIASDVCLIFPTGWQEPKNANNLSKMNTREIKEDQQIVFIDNRQNVFDGVAGAEWTNVIYWRENHNNGLEGSQRILTNGSKPEVKRLLCERALVEKPAEIVEMANIVTGTAGFRDMCDSLSSLKPYGLRTDFMNNPSKYNLPELHESKQPDDKLTIYGLKDRRQTKMYCPEEYPLPKITKRLGKYKVFIGKAWGNFSSSYLGGAYADIVIASPYELCTENFIETGCFEDFETAKKHSKYLMTTFCRALLFRNKNSQDNSKEKWSAVPVQDYSEPWWSESIDVIDSKLFEKYAIPKNIATFVKTNIQQKNESNIVNFDAER